MAYVPIPKDLKKVKTKVAFNLTRRQLIGFSVAALVGIPTYLFMRKFVPNDIAVIFLIVATLPIFFITLFEKDGLTFEKYFKYIYLHKFYQPSKRVRREVYLEQEKKNTADKLRKKSKNLSTKQEKSKKREDGKGKEK
ncbi:PrgI family protein [Streptococcus suis]|jgi:hypothetical protein|uniref:PrgI family protein n=1 Tax=Streptococcus suis TaxID=1307 RepID=UPI002A935D57|nr:PrgI family protein [Fusobacterium necrophorum]